MQSTLVAIVLGTCLVSVVSAQNGIIQNIPGAKTAAGVISATLDGGKQYLAPDGPIQPALTAIGGLPMRGTEMANRGISHISSGLGSGARRLSEASGNNGNVNMPGLETAESMMPEMIHQMGGGMRNMIKQKNNMIRGQAEAAISSANRQGEMIRNGFSGMVKSSMNDMSGMMNGAQDAMMQGSSTLQNQLKSSLDSTMNRMNSMRGMGSSMRNQAEGMAKTMANGISGSLSHLHQTGEQLRNQMQGGMKQNMGTMSNVLGSLQDSAMGLTSNLQSNVQGLMGHAQKAASQITNHLERSLSGPLNMLQNLGGSMSSMAQGGAKAATGVFVVALAGVARIEAQENLRQATGNYGQDAINYAQNLPSQMQNGMIMGQQPGNFLSSLLGGNQNQGASGPLETLRQLPARGLQMLNNVFTGVRNMLPLGLGRNANTNQSNQGNSNLLGQLNPNQLLQNLPRNPITDMAQGLLGGQNRNGNGSGNGSGNGLGLPLNLNQITNPILEPLQQGRLPDVGEITRGTTNTVRDLTSGLMRLPNSLGNTLNNGAQQAQGGLGGMLSSLTSTTTN